MCDTEYFINNKYLSSCLQHMAVVVQLTSGIIPKQWRDLEKLFDGVTIMTGLLHFWDYWVTADRANW